MENQTLFAQLLQEATQTNHQAVLEALKILEPHQHRIGRLKSVFESEVRAALTQGLRMLQQAQANNEPSNLALRVKFTTLQALIDEMEAQARLLTTPGSSFIRQ